MAEVLSEVGAVRYRERDDRLAKLALLVSRGGRDAETAFEDIVHICEKGVYELAVGVTKNREDALDISQETFIKLWRLMTESFPEEPVTAWYSYILRMARNCTLDFLRKQKIRCVEPLVLEGEDGEEKELVVADDDIASDPVRSYERKERIAAVREAIASLDEDYRQILVLRENEDLSYQEISEIMGIEMGTVKSRIFRARMQVKKYLEERHFFK